MEEILTAVREFLKIFPGAEVRLDEPMRRHTSFRIGGPVAAMALPADEQELTVLCAIARRLGVEPFVFGNGTNLLVEDAPLDILAIKTTGLNRIEGSGTALSAGCGALLSRLAAEAMSRGLTGLEFAHGIPGSVGGAVSMNAGAYGGEMKDVVTEVRYLTPEGEVCTARGAENAFSYRRSRYSDTDALVLGARFALEPGNIAEIRAKMDDLAARRREKQPLNLPSAGSTFKRPRNGFAAAMIEQAGLKGKGFGGACVSEKHAGFVVSRDGATFDDVIRTMALVRETVYRKDGVLLEPEVKIIRRDRALWNTL